MLNILDVLEEVVHVQFISTEESSRLWTGVEISSHEQLERTAPRALRL
jgi:hypothetical protein